MKDTIRLAWRMLRRDWRAGELRVLVAALVLAVASVATVGFFTNRVEAALARQANLLLGGDLLISGDRPLPPTFAAAARERGLSVVDGVRFNSMIQAPGSGATAELVLTDVRAFGQGYPLRGELRLVDPAFPDGRSVKGIPAPGEVWIDTRLASRLAVSPGQALGVGETTLRVSGVVQQEPEVGGGFLSFAPKLVMNLADVPATNLLQPGNRATWRLLVAGARVDEFTAWARTATGPGQRVETVRDIRPEVKASLERAEKFLGLASLVSVVLAAVAVALSASRYLRRHLDAAAVIRCLGATQRRTLALYLVQFLLLGVAASALGVAIGLAGQQALVAVLRSVVDAELPRPGWLPGVKAGFTGLMLLLGFAVPPLIALAKVPPLRVLRRDLGAPRLGGWLAYLGGALIIAGLIWWQARDAKTGAIVLAGVAALLLVASLVAWLLIAAVKLVPQKGYGWRYGLANLRRRPFASSLQIGALGLGLMALLLLTIVRGDLLTTWRTSLPPDAPNKFLINVMPDQVEPLSRWFGEARIATPTFAPMIRGRLTAINDRPVTAADFVDERAKRLVDREFNLSWSAQLPRGNSLVAGGWWRGEQRGVMSLEEGIAETLGVRVGDRLLYDVAGMPLVAEVTSLRKVDWDSFRVNFFALFPPGNLEAMPKTFITSFRVPETDTAAAARLVQQFPNVLLIDVSEIMRQVQRIMDQVARAVEFVFLFTLAAGLLVLQAAIAATQDERQYDAAILRTLGARRRQLRSAQLVEFLVLGVLAGILAAAGASAVGFVLSDRVFQIPYRVSADLWMVGIVAGALAVAASGWLGTRGTLDRPPLSVIRALE
jgi:putative ABC transport system permease protein